MSPHSKPQQKRSKKTHFPCWTKASTATGAAWPERFRHADTFRLAKVYSKRQSAENNDEPLVLGVPCSQSHFAGLKTLSSQRDWWYSNHDGTSARFITLNEEKSSEHLCKRRHTTTQPITFGPQPDDELADANFNWHRYTLVASHLQTINLLIYASLPSGN
jgi:hypothetical protein